MKRKNRMRMLALLVVMSLCAALCACGGGGGSETTPGTTAEPAGPVTYTVLVRSQNGLPLQDVGVLVYADAGLSDLVWFEKTDADGQMCFTADRGSYVAVLTGVPEGYAVSEQYAISGVLTEISLAVTELEPDEDVVFAQGDVMMDFSVTDPEGNVYTLSELLSRKEAVVLNFWYIGCDPCKAEFPYLQEAYEAYSDSIEVLAMNPVNQDDAAIAQFRDELGLTFPTVRCDSAWEAMMQIVGYPTTAVIDRYGTVSLVHTGSITSTDAFKEIFAHFAAENYENGQVEDVEDLTDIPQVQGNPDSPIEVGGITRLDVTLQPGEVLYYHVYKVSGMYMQFNKAGVYALYNGKTYDDKFGKVVTTEGITVPVEVAFGNSTDEAVTFTVYFSALAGSYGNPYKMELGQFDTSVSAGNDQGVYYTYTAPGNGTLTVECISATHGVDYNYVLYNLNTYAYRTLREDGTGRSVSVKVNKGDKIQLIISPLPDSENQYPAAKFTSVATFSDGTQSEQEELVEQVTYAVTVTDADRQPISGVFVYLDADGKQLTLQTNADGVAYTRLDPGTYTATVKVPADYTGRTTQFTLTEKMPCVAVKLDKTVPVVTVTYTVTVVDSLGEPVPGAMVSMGGSFAYTDESGTVTFALEQGDYLIVVSGPDGSSQQVMIAGSATEATVILEQSVSEPEVQTVTYTVSVLDYADQPLADAAAVSFYDAGGNVAAVAVADEFGIASAELEEGSYTASVSFPAQTDYHYDVTPVALTADEPAATVRVAMSLSGEMEQKYFGDLYTVTAGSTYVSLQSEVENYFVFSPEESGRYRISIVETDGVLRYWGANMMFIFDQTNGTDMKDNSFTVNAKEESVGYISHILGISGDTDCVIVITRIGDAVLDYTDMEWTVYEAVTPPQAYTYTGGALTAVDLTAGGYTLVKDSDGCYRFDSADGPTVYVNLGPDAPYVSMYNMLGGNGYGGTALRKYFFDEEGNCLKKEDYTQCLLQYVECRDSSAGVYPLTDDLMYMLQQGGDQMGWYEAESHGYLFGAVEGLNPEIAWMFACCYQAG